MKILITRQLVGGFKSGTVVEIADDKAAALIAEGTATAELPAPSAEELQVIEDEKKIADNEAKLAADKTEETKNI